jgi:predicted nucleic acid-binding protein
VASSTRLGVVAATVTLVDTCVLLDVLTDDPTFAPWSKAALADARDAGDLVISPLVYAELCTGFERIEDVDAALPSTDFTREPLPYHAGFLASRAFLAYRKRGGTRRTPLTDFYIGAHAAVNRYRLLTRDAARFRTYFPSVHLITPGENDD